MKEAAPVHTSLIERVLKIHVKIISKGLEARSAGAQVP